MVGLPKPFVAGIYGHLKTLTPDATREQSAGPANEYSSTPITRHRYDKNIRLCKYHCKPARYQQILAQQGGVCAVCGAAPKLKSKLAGAVAKLEVDHDHTCKGQRSCGKCIRGLLCHRCNAALGNADDSSDRLRKLADYLDRSSSKV